MRMATLMKRLKESVCYLIDNMKKILFLFIAGVLTSCTGNTIFEKPKDLIPKDTMILLITDLFIAKSTFNEKNLQNNRKVNYMPLVYNKYKIDSTRFINSNLYYTSKFEEYDLIYKEINKKLLLKKEEIEKNIKKGSKNNTLDSSKFNDPQ